MRVRNKIKKGEATTYLRRFCVVVIAVARSAVVVGL